MLIDYFFGSPILLTFLCAFDDFAHFYHHDHAKKKHKFLIVTDLLQIIPVMVEFFSHYSAAVKTTTKKLSYVW